MWLGEWLGVVTVPSDSDRNRAAAPEGRARSTVVAHCHPHPLDPAEPTPADIGVLGTGAFVGELTLEDPEEQISVGSPNTGAARRVGSTDRIAVPDKFGRYVLTGINRSEWIVARRPNRCVQLPPGPGRLRRARRTGSTLRTSRSPRRELATAIAREWPDCVHHVRPGRSGELSA